MLSLITGASGFIGSHLLESLISKGKEVRVLVRKTSDLSFIKNFDVDIFYGDISDKDSVEKAMDGVDVIYHLAFIDLKNVSPQTYIKTNVDAVKNVFDSCMDVNVKKVLITSSISAVGLSNIPQLIDETYPCNPRSAYELSKFEIEKLSMQYFHENEIPIIIVRPSMVYGPRQPFGSNKLYLAIKNGRFAFINDGKNKWPLCYVKNIVDGMILAVEKEQSIGEIYFLSDEKSYMLKDVVKTIAMEEGVNVPKTSIPKWLAISAATVFTVINKLTKIEVPIRIGSIRLLTMNMEFDISKAERELGYEPKINLEEGMTKTVKWLKEQKIV